MPVTSTTARVSYTASGSQTVFPYTFRILNETHVRVYVAGTLKTLGTDYSVSGVGVAAGGNITFVTAPVAAASVVFLRNVPLTQQTAYVEHDPFPASSHNDALDKLTMVVQQLNEAVGRAVKFNDFSAFSSVEMPDLAASKFLRVNPAGTALELVTASAADVVGVLDDTIPSCAYGELPAAGTPGRLRRVTDKARGGVLYMDNGTDLWVPQGDIAGESRDWEGTIAGIPGGYFHCDGSAKNRANYPELFAAIGTIHGVGDGSTTFNLPDSRDKFPVGAKQDDSGVPKTNLTGTLTQSGGNKDHTHPGLIHNHVWYEKESNQGAGEHDQTYNSAGTLIDVGTGVGKDATHRAIEAPNAATPLQSVNLYTSKTAGDNTGNNSAVQPYRAVVKIIKY